MADNIVGNLFGVDLQTLQQAQDAKARAENLQIAQLDPFQARVFQGGEMGRAIGKGINTLFGLEDPMLVKQRKENEILQSIPPDVAKDPYELASTVFEKARAAGLNDLANHAYQQMQAAKMQFIDQSVKSTTMAKNIAEAEKARKEQNPTLDAWKALAGKSTPESVNESVKNGFDLTKLILKETEKNISPENKAEQVKLDKFILDFGPIVGNDKFLEWKQNQDIELKRAGKTEINLPSEGSKTEDVVRIEKSWKDNVGPYEAKLQTIGTALNLANMAQTNPSASNLLDTEIAKLAQDGKLSNKDVDLVRSGNASVFQRLGDKIGIFLSGRQTDLTLKDKVEIIKAYEAGAAKQYNQASDRTANIWSTSPIGKNTIEQLRKGREKYVVGGGLSEQLDPNYDYVQGSDGKTYRKAKVR